jgi:hypothetical protein
MTAGELSVNLLGPKAMCAKRSIGIMGSLLPR